MNKIKLKTDKVGEENEREVNYIKLGILMKFQND